MKFLLALALLSLPAFADESAVCNGYLTIQNELRCPADGYLMSTGYRLCREYVADDARFTTAGRRSMALIRRCLTRALLARAGSLTCDNVEDAGFASHVGCYVRSGFCELPLSDKSLVFKHAAGMIFEGKAWRQFPKIEAACRQR